MNFLKNKRILITGAAGTIGQNLIEKIISNDKSIPNEVLGIDSNESALFFADQKFNKHKNVNLFLGDIRERDFCERHMEGIDLVFHTAALKHVILCEKSPMEAVNTNLIGLNNLINASMNHCVEKFIFTSSDKAVNPTNVMGTSKLMGERLVTAANSIKRKGEETIFASTRFGNVLGSSGSVVPVFVDQIRKGGPLTLTDGRMSRFVMNIKQACDLVLDSCEQAKGGEVFVTKMPVVDIRDLADALKMELCGTDEERKDSIEVIEIGAKPGEKLYEELMSDEETGRALQTNKFFIILPAFRAVYDSINYEYAGLIDKSVTNPYNSHHEPRLTVDEIRKFLIESDLVKV